MSNKFARLSPATLTDQEVDAFSAIVDLLSSAKPAIKTCGCCGRLHESIPAGARHSNDECYGGYYWECACGSTLFVPESRVGVAA